MKKIMKKHHILFYSLVSVVGIPVTLLSFIIMTLLIGLNIPYGRHLLEEKIPNLSGNMLYLEGISGAFPWDIHLRKITINDPHGAFVSLDNVALSWSPLALAEAKLKINTLSAEGIFYNRAPLFAPSPKPVAKKSSNFSLPLGVEIDHFDIEKINIAPKALKKTISYSFSLSLHAHLSIATIAPFMGKIEMEHLPNMAIEAHIKRLDSLTALDISLAHQNNQKTPWHGQIDYDEDQKGFATILASMPNLDPLSLHFKLKGGLDNLHHHLSLKAGLLNGEVTGQSNLIKKQIKAALKISSPSFSLGDKVGWDRLTIYSDIHGDFTHPYGKALLDLDGLNIKNNMISHLQLLLNAEQDIYTLFGQVDGVKMPHRPFLFEKMPLILKAHFSPFTKEKDFQLSLSHEIMELDLKGALKPALKAHLSLNLPQLEPLAAMGNIALGGKTDFVADIALASPNNRQDRIHFKENLSLISGQKQAVNLIGAHSVLEGSIIRDEEGIIHIDPVMLHGDNIGLQLKGIFSPYKKSEIEHHKATDLEAIFYLPNLSKLHQVILGNLSLKAHLEGFLDDLSLKAHSDMRLGLMHPKIKMQPGDLHLDLNAEHLPQKPQIQTNIEGILDKSPLLLNADFTHDDKILAHVILHQLSWKSLEGKGDIILPVGQKIPQGMMDIKLQKLENFRHLIGQDITGMVRLSFVTQNISSQENLDFSLLSRLKMAHYQIDNFSIKGKIEDIIKNPVANISLNIKKASINEITGGVDASLKGSQNALALKLRGDFKNLLKDPAFINLSLLENVPDKIVTLQQLAAQVKKEKLQILRPVTLSYGREIKMSRLLLTISSPHTSIPLSLDMVGMIKPNLSFNGSLTHLSPALLQDFVPSLKAEGDIAASAHLQGTIEKPRGEVSLSANRLHMMTEPAASLPKASLMMKALFDGKQAHLSSDVEAGKDLKLSLSGDVPFNDKGTLGIKTEGKMNLAMANAILGASAMGVSGNLLFDLIVDGHLKKPSLKGDVRLEKGGFDHYGQGVHLQNIEAHIQALGDKLHIEQFSLSAGKGMMKLSGDIGVLQPSLPLNLDFIADKAEPLKSDMIEEVINAHLHIQGQATTHLDVGGKVLIPHVTINIPDSFPSSVPQLEVVDLKKEAKERKKFAPPFTIGLNIDLHAPGEFFVHGHGLFAEMQGNLHIGGSNLAPEISGGFDLRRGNFNLAGINLNFSHGRVGFNGTGVGHKLDPTLNFQADRNASGVLASLLVSGYASAPKIDFTSTPQKPKDEILSILLFGTNRASLSTTQLAELGSAVVQLGGGKAFDPLGMVRNSLGLDHLAVGGGNSVGNGGTSIEAGKYVLKGVYVGAKEGVSGGGSQAQVKIDLTKNLKLNTVVGTGGQVTGFTTPENDPGSSIGLSYGIDY